jgi:hypothetical protein
MLPETNEEYATKEYWSVQLTNWPFLISKSGTDDIHCIHVFLLQIRSHTCSEPADGSFDWFKNYSDISNVLQELIPDHSSRILVLGCGNSKLSEEVSSGYPFLSELTATRCTMLGMHRKFRLAGRSSLQLPQHRQHRCQCIHLSLHPSFLETVFVYSDSTNAR